MVVFLAVPVLASAISAGANQLADPKPELKQKTSWMVVNVENNTQFTVQITRDRSFKSGRFYDAPGNITKFSQSAFSVCNKQYLPTGVTGIVRFELDIPEEEKIPISIAFSNPLFGEHKIRAEFTDDMEGVYGRLDKGSAEGEEKVLGERKTEDGETVNVKFRVVSIPSDNAKVTITQIEDPVKRLQRVTLDRAPTVEEPHPEDNHPPAVVSAQDSVDTGEMQLVELEPQHLIILINLLSRRIAMHWMNIGLQLGFQNGELQIIQAKPGLQARGDPAFFQEMLSEWLNWYDPPHHPPPTIEALAKAIRPSDQRVAGTLKDDFLKAI